MLNNLTTEEKRYIGRKYVERMGFFEFLRFIGYGDLNSVHEELGRFMEGRWGFKMVLMPRYSFKSSICTVGYILWRLVRDRNLRVLIYSDATSKAEGFLGVIKSHCEGKVSGSRLAALFDWYNTDKWNESEIIIAERGTALDAPSVDTGGIETSKVGKHYDLIVFDDIVSDKNVTTKAQMDKVEECYGKALSLLRPGGDVVMVGTRWHFGDLYGRILAQNGERQTFRTFIRPAIDKDGKYLFDNIGKNSLTAEFLEQQRIQQGSYIFSVLYQNEPTDPETAVFKHADFGFYGDVKPDDLYITATCDPAGEGEDFTAITVVGTDNNMEMYILDLVNEHLQPSEICDEIIRLHNRYAFKILGLEINFFRGMLRIELERRIKEEEQNNPKFRRFAIHEFEATARRGEGKHNRMMSLQPYHERGAIKFPGKSVELLKGAFSELAYQMIQFPNSAHDDLHDAMGWQVPLIRKGGVVKKADYPKNSIAYLERKLRDEEIKKQDRIPRRYRKQIPELSFV